MQILILGGLDVTPETVYRLGDVLVDQGHIVNVVLWSDLNRNKKKKKFYRSYSLLDYYSKCVRDIINSSEYDKVITYSVGSNVLLRVLNEIDEYLDVIMISPSYYKNIQGKFRGILVPGVFLGYFIEYIKSCIGSKWEVNELLTPIPATCLFMETVGDLYQLSSFSTHHVYILRGDNDVLVSNRNIKMLTDSLITVKEFISSGTHQLLKYKFKDTVEAVIYILDHYWDDL